MDRGFIMSSEKTRQNGCYKLLHSSRIETSCDTRQNDHSWTEDCEELARIFDWLDVSGKVEVLNTAYREKLRCLSQYSEKCGCERRHGAIGDRSVQ